jgi:hypothetical protein
MSCSIIRNKEGEVSKVLAPNGKESILYDGIVEQTGNPEESVGIWALAYTDAFKENFGDWETPNNPDVITQLDTNGEPSVHDVLSYSLLPEEEIDEQEEVDQVEAEEETQSPDKQLNEKILKFLSKIGVSYNAVNRITDASGQSISAIAKADMLNKIIEVVENRADATTLPEEAAHFFVEMLGENHPLYKEMFNQITSYRLYSEVVEQYKNNPEYRTAEGRINFDKLKKEAIGKLIAQHIISDSISKPTTTEELDKNLGFLYKWWSKVLAFVQSVFNKAEGQNPFATVATQIKEADVSELDQNKQLEGVYYQQGEGYDLLLQHQNDITLDASINETTGQKRHDYYIAGKRIARTVTTTKVDAYYKKLFKHDNRSSAQKEIDLLKAEYGDIIHEVIDEIVKSYVDPITHEIREERTPVKHPIVEIEEYQEILSKLEDFIKPLLGSYPTGTKILTEVRIYDAKQDMAGSIDFLAIRPDGTADIYDWKSQEISKNQEDLKPWKAEAYRIQLGEYKRILKEQYGIRKFDKVRAIPIRTDFYWTKTKDGEYSIDALKDVEIGNYNSTLISEDQSYLLPVLLDEETGFKNIDELIKKLQGIHDRIEKKRVRGSEVYIKNEELKAYKLAIRDLQLRQSLGRFIDLGFLEIDRYNYLVKEGRLKSKDIIKAKEVLEVFASTSGILKTTFDEMLNEMKEQGDEEGLALALELEQSYNNMTVAANSTLKDIEEEMKQIATQLAERNGINNLLTAEKKVGFFAGMFNSMSTQPTKAVKTFYKLIREAQSNRDVKFDLMSTKMIALREGMMKWGASKGLTGEKLFNIMLGFDDKGKWNGKFLARYESKYYTDKEQATRNRDKKWFEENTIFDQTAYEEEKARKKKYYDELVVDSDPEVNAEKTKAMYERWITNHSAKFEGYFNLKSKFVKPKEKWETTRWKELTAVGNEPAYETYKFFRSLVSKAEDIGMLDEFSPNFIPNMYKGKLDQITFGNFKNIFSNAGFFENLAVDSGSEYFPDTDPVSGEVLNRVPVFYTGDIGKINEDGSKDYTNKSVDLFKVFGIWGAHMYSYEAMQSIEDDALVLAVVERTKDSLLTNMFNEVKRQANGQITTIKGNERNADILDDFMNYYLYNKRTGEQYDVKIKLFGKTISLTKTLEFILGFFSLKTLALNPLSASAQFVGGTGNAFLLASKKVLFNTTDWTSAMYSLSKMDKKSYALLDHFNLLLEDTKRNKLDKLSVSKVMANVTVDKMYFMQRIADKGVQHPIGIVMMKNYMLDETGKLVNIMQYVKSQYDYANFYTTYATEAERKAVEKEIDEKVGKLKETKSIYATAEIKDDTLVTPGLEPGTKAAEEFRAAVKKATKIILGNSTSDDINLIRTTSLGMALMQFRSWIPQMFKERFGELYKDDDLDIYQQGKVSLLITELFSKRIGQLVKGFIPFAGNQSMIDAARVRYQEERAQAFELGQEFDITEGEYVDMYLGNVRSAMREIMIVLAFMALLYAVKPGDDDDEEYKGMRKYLARAMSKYYNEFAFYYNPLEFTNLINAPFPVVNLGIDVMNLFKHTLEQAYGGATGNVEYQDDAKPLKYLGKIMPITKELLMMGAIFDDDFRKEWDIRIQ